MGKRFNLLWVFVSLSSNHKNGKKNGFGKLVWPDGSVFEGNFEADQIEGLGKFTWPNKKVY